MRKTNKSKSIKTLEENVKQQYLTEYTSEREFKQLSEDEKKLNLAEYAATEYLNTTNIVDAVLNGKKKSNTIFNGLETKLNNTAYFKNVEKSQGDITLTEHHKNLVSLLKYAVVTNAGSTVKNTGTIKFDSAATDILNCLKEMEKSKNTFKKIIKDEKTLPVERQLGSAFYKSTVFLLQMTGDILYSNSINVVFNHNLKPVAVENVYFSYDSDVVDNLLDSIREITSGLKNGKIFKAFSKTVQEDFSDSIDKITLNEDVLDVIFGLVTHFKIPDLFILFPIYLTRSIIYWMGFTYLSLKNISLDINRSIQVTRASNGIDVDAYDSYKADALKKTHIIKSSLDKADAAIDLDARSDKKALAALNNAANHSVLI